MDAREKLLEVAARVYAESGYRGTTTRRVAEEAGVNEVTLFRHFGTKDALIKAALEEVDRRSQPEPLPDPRDPRTELLAYVSTLFERFYRQRHLVSRVLGDMVEHPGIAPAVCEEPNQAYYALVRYFERMRDAGLLRADAVPEAAAGILLDGTVSHALFRDLIPAETVPPVEVVLAQYVDLVLRGVGVKPRRVSGAA